MRKKKKKTFWSTHTLISLCVVCREGKKKKKENYQRSPWLRKESTKQNPHQLSDD